MKRKEERGKRDERVLGGMSAPRAGSLNDKKDEAKGRGNVLECGSCQGSRENE